MLTPSSPPPEHDCLTHLEDAKHVSRATWVCPVCGKDVSLEYVCYQEALTAERETFPSQQ